MAYKKQNFKDGEVLTAAHLNHIESGISDLENTVNNGTGGQAGEDGGYYIPSVSANGTLTWSATKSKMPSVASANIKGQQGDKGDPGKGIVSIVRTAGNGAAGTTDTYTITYTDNTTSLFTVYNGANGKDGTGGSGGTGENGEDGATFTPYVDANGNLSWSNDKGLANPPTVNIKGEDGKDGTDGEDGQNGISPTITVTPITGGNRITINDVNGTKTIDVLNGADGEDGKDGTNGTDGVGINGTNGKDGEDGEDGFSPIVTISEIDGGHKVQITDKNGTQSFDVMDAPSEIITATSSDGVNYVATVPSITALTPGVNFVMIPSMTSASTAPKLNVNNLGTKTIRQPLTTNTSATAPGTTDTWLAVNKPVRVMYDGTYWKTIEIPRPSATGLYGVVPVANGGVPSSTSDDNGKFLRVVDGAAAWVTVDYAEGVSF